MRYKPSDVSREIGPDGVEHMYVNGALAIRMFIIFAAAYIMSYAFRAINAVIAQPLVNELGLSAGQLGFLASAYFLSFAVMQLPVGVMLDRYGPRRVEAVLIGFAALGALLLGVIVGTAFADDMVDRFPVHYARFQSYFIATRYNRLELLSRIRNSVIERMHSYLDALVTLNSNNKVTNTGSTAVNGNVVRVCGQMMLGA